MLVSGIVDLILAGCIIAGLPGTALWALGLLVGINLLFGGAALSAWRRGAAAGLRRPLRRRGTGLSAVRTGRSWCSVPPRALLCDRRSKWEDEMQTPFKIIALGYAGAAVAAARRLKPTTIRTSRYGSFPIPRPAAPSTSPSAW